MTRTRLDSTTRGRLRAAPRVALVLLAALALGACGGDDSRNAEAAEASKLVLQPADLPRGWQPFDVGRQLRTDLGSRGATAGAWKARYRRAGTTEGPLVIDSRADVFGSEAAAKEGLGALEEALPSLLPDGGEIELPPLGDAAFGAMSAEPAAEQTVRHYLVAWRRGNVTAFVLVNGFDPFPAAQAVSLARKQDDRIAELLRK